MHLPAHSAPHDLTLRRNCRHLQVVWSALPGDRRTYAVQRWPDAATPTPGQPGWESSLLPQAPQPNPADGTLSLMDAHGGWSAARAAALGAGSSSSSSGLAFYRVLALGGDGGVLAATEAAQPFDAGSEPMHGSA